MMLRRPADQRSVVPAPRNVSRGLGRPRNVPQRIQTHFARLAGVGRDWAKRLMCRCFVMGSTGIE